MFWSQSWALIPLADNRASRTSENNTPRRRGSRVPRPSRRRTTHRDRRPALAKHHAPMIAPSARAVLDRPELSTMSSVLVVVNLMLRGFSDEACKEELRLIEQRRADQKTLVAAVENEPSFRGSIRVWLASSATRSTPWWRGVTQAGRKSWRSAAVVTIADRPHSDSRRLRPRLVGESREDADGSCRRRWHARGRPRWLRGRATTIADRPLRRRGLT